MWILVAGIGRDDLEDQNHAGVGAFVLLQGVQDGDQSQRSRPSHQLLVIGVEHVLLRKFAWSV